MECHVLIWEELIFKKKFTQSFEIVLHVMKIKISLLQGRSLWRSNDNSQDQEKCYLQQLVLEGPVWSGFQALLGLNWDWTGPILFWILPDCHVPSEHPFNSDLLRHALALSGILISFLFYFTKSISNHLSPAFRTSSILTVLRPFRGYCFRLRCVP